MRRGGSGGGGGMGGMGGMGGGTGGGMRGQGMSTTAILAFAAIGFLGGFLITHMLSTWLSVMQLSHQHTATRDYAMPTDLITNNNNNDADDDDSMQDPLDDDLDEYTIHEDHTLTPDSAHSQHEEDDTTSGTISQSSNRLPGIHFVITSNGNTYMNWQTRVLYQTFLKHKGAKGSALAAFTRYILLGETDYLLVKPLAQPNLARGEGMGFPFGYIIPTYPTIKEPMERLYPPELGPLSDIPNTGNAPVMMRADDMTQVVQLWEQVVDVMEADAEAVEKLGWVREMYAFSIACAKAHVRMDLPPPPNNVFMVQPPMDRSMGKAAMMHYTWGTEMYTKQVKDGKEDYTMVWTYDKRTYMGGQYHQATFRLDRIPELPEWEPNKYFLQEWFKREEVTKELMDILRLEAKVFNEAIDSINNKNNGLPQGFTSVEAAVKAGEPGEQAKQARQRVEQLEREKAERKKKAEGR
eukprot:jgi/Chlat1/4136/Chrsp269S00808